jgi:MT-A70
MIMHSDFDLDAGLQNREFAGKRCDQFRSRLERIQSGTLMYGGEDPVAFVISINLRRRHLDESQRAMVAARLATLKQGARTDISPIGEMSQSDAAALLSIGKRTVERAREVLNQGAPELVHAVEQGKVSVSAAADVATLPAGEQQEIVARGEQEILKAAVAIRARKNERRVAERMRRLVEISAGNAPLPQDRKYPVIYADPPWKYETPSMGDAGRAVENHYPCMQVADICNLPIKEITTQDCVLFMWVVSPLLTEAFDPD